MTLTTTHAPLHAAHTRYGMGLLASFVAVMTYRMAQLGLLYIMLLTLGALALLGLWHGELLKLWRLISTLNILLH
ncbi:hypothetical protein GR268_45375, partial [Rhizobium leguminosarum]|nr:hypothetical protein [Rhizobium leguminosarum]